jgi:hypothetical protein
MNMKARTNIAKSPEYQAALAQYKTNLEMYQGETKWYYEGYESGVNFHGEEITLEEMQRAAKKVSPVGPPVAVHEIEDMTPSWEEYCKFEDYNAYMKWIEDQDDIFYYFRERDEFHVGTGLQIAASLGHKKIIMENLS